ncbi:hypothetical protein EYF80_062929 [Liparis tanakae]|uniref:Uncharacterized protein n=1 Tax=Liparis tanakae TaxID=230148 RepID=A0A4Z2EDJ7_9TELE|nr:hypothetical protein EYF80_062929 [Liparis tanakae]
MLTALDPEVSFLHQVTSAETLCTLLSRSTDANRFIFYDELEEYLHTRGEPTNKRSNYKPEEYLGVLDNTA